MWIRASLSFSDLKTHFCRCGEFSATAGPDAASPDPRLSVTFHRSRRLLLGPLTGGVRPAEVTYGGFGDGAGPPAELLREPADVEDEKTSSTRFKRTFTLALVLFR